MSAAQGWLWAARHLYPGLEAQLRRLTKHAGIQWSLEDYDMTEDGRSPVDTLDEAEAVSSLVRTETWPEIPDDGSGKSKPEETVRYHDIAVDVDVPAWLVPSTTPGHSHLHVWLPDGGAMEDAYFAWLDASAAIGLLEDGYVAACKARGMTSLRVPWVVKEEEG